MSDVFSIQPCRTFKLRLFAKIYTDLEKNNQKNKGTTLKIRLKKFTFGPKLIDLKSVNVSLEKPQATTAHISWKIDDQSEKCVEGYRVQVEVDGETKDKILQDTETILNLMPCSTHKVKVSPIYNNFIGIADPIE